MLTLPGVAIAEAFARDEEDGLDPELVQKIEQRGLPCVQGDATDDGILIAAGVNGGRPPSSDRCGP